MQAGEGGLAILAERDILVRLELLYPNAEFELLTSFGPRYLVLVRIKVAGNMKIAAVVAACQSELRLRIGGCASSYNHSAYLMSDEKTGNVGRGSAGRRLAREEVGCA